MGERRSWKVWVIGVLITALFGVISVLYADIRDDISKKADKTLVERMSQDIIYIRDGVDELKRRQMKP